MSRAEGFMGPIISVVGGTESNLSSVATELAPGEKTSWSRLFSAFLDLDTQVGQTGIHDTKVVGYEFPVDIDGMPDDFWTTQIRGLFVNPLTHLTEIIEVSLLKNGDNRYMHGVCQAIWEDTTPVPFRTQYHFANGNGKGDFYKLLRLAALKTSEAEIPTSRRKLD